MNLQNFIEHFFSKINKKLSSQQKIKHILFHKCVVSDGRFCLGLYENWDNCISISTHFNGYSLPEDKIFKTLLHEIGHWFHYRILNKSFGVIGNEYFAESFAQSFYHSVEKSHSKALTFIHQLYHSYTDGKKMNRSEIEQIFHSEVINNKLYEKLLNAFYE